MTLDLFTVYSPRLVQVLNIFYMNIKAATFIHNMDIDISNHAIINNKINIGNAPEFI